MKCDELQYERLGDANKTYPASTLVIRKQFVDAAIADLKTKLAEEREFGLNRAKSADHEIGKLCAELCELKAENRKHQRALWLARAERAMIILDYFTLKCRWFKDYLKVEPPKCDVKMIRKWAGVERKCRAKAEEYK